MRYYANRQTKVNIIAQHRLLEVGDNWTGICDNSFNLLFFFVVSCCATSFSRPATSSFTGPPPVALRPWGSRCARPAVICCGFFLLVATAGCDSFLLGCPSSEETSLINVLHRRLQSRLPVCFKRPRGPRIDPTAQEMMNEALAAANAAQRRVNQQYRDSSVPADGFQTEFNTNG